MLVFVCPRPGSPRRENDPGLAGSGPQSKECDVKRILFLSTILALVAAAGRIIMGRRSGDEDEA